MSNQENIRLVVGYDAREAVAYHVFVQSVIEHATIPVSFHPPVGTRTAILSGASCRWQ